MTTAIKTCKIVSFKYAQFTVCQLYRSKGDLKRNSHCLPIPVPTCTWKTCWSVNRAMPRVSGHCDAHAHRHVPWTCPVHPVFTTETQLTGSQQVTPSSLAAQGLRHGHRTCWDSPAPSLSAGQDCRPRVARLCPWSEGGKSQDIYGEMSQFFNAGSKKFLKSIQTKQHVWKISGRFQFWLYHNLKNKKVLTNSGKQITWSNTLCKPLKC